MTKVEELRQQIKDMRENGAEPEDITQVVQELNMELARAGSTLPFNKIKVGGGKAKTKKEGGAE